MIEAAVRHAQPIPTFEEPDGRSVRVTLHGSVDLTVFSLLRRVPRDTWDTLSSSDLAALDAVRRRVPRSEVSQKSTRRLVERGLVEPGGTGNSPLIYASLLQGSELTTDAFGPALVEVLRRLKEAPLGVRYVDLRDEVDADPDEVRRILQWMRRNGLAYTTGRTRGTRWHYQDSPESQKE